MNSNKNEKKGKRKICYVLLVVALLGIITIVPSAYSTNLNTDDHKIISDNLFSTKNLSNSHIFSEIK